MKTLSPISGRSSLSGTSSSAYEAFLPNTGYVRVGTVAAVCGIAVSTVWAWSSQGRLPSPVKLSKRVTAWHAADLRAFLDDPIGWQAASTSKNREAHDE